MTVLCLKRFGRVAGIVEHLHHQTAAAAGTSQGVGQTAAVPQKQRKSSNHSMIRENEAFGLGCATARGFHLPCFSERSRKSHNYSF